MFVRLFTAVPVGNLTTKSAVTELNISKKKTRVTEFGHAFNKGPFEWAEGVLVNGEAQNTYH